jgi:homopolymeric O-antigen transport system permease protein
MSSTSFESTPEVNTVGQVSDERTSNGYLLPRKPIITITGSKAWLPLNIRQLWRSRELLFFLMWRDVKVRYKQTVLGGAWVILQPLVMMIIFTFFFGKVARLPTEGIPSALFYYTGLTLWTFFTNSVMSGANSLSGNTNLITKIYFPRLLIPTAAVFAGLIDLGVASLLFIPLVAYFGIGLTWKLLLVGPLSILITALTLGVGTLFAALNVRYRDVRYILPFLLQVWFFLSPIIYPSSFVPPEWRWALAMNPLTNIVEAFRCSLFGLPIHWWWLGYSLAFTILVLFGSAYLFRRMETSFAEMI